MKRSYLVAAMLAGLAMAACTNTKTDIRSEKTIKKIASCPNQVENRQRLFALKQGFSDADIEVRQSDICSGYIFGVAQSDSPYSGAQVRAKFTHSPEDDASIEIGITGVKDNDAKANLSRVIRNGYRDYLKAPY
ncbi:hypothetical protein [Sulfitobacter sp. R18_1]|uniref:hypothetical protein n=1 Tax=Sulfitobacter sp. R18_1 TaxID=2821104 RepID=UPI001ADC5C52|nr:hypothetical protein [Sulfitobacter sp. R18_1]MBO9428785.1 hypothetical protein [Sulfitobacter sp. R18_1]